MRPDTRPERQTLAVPSTGADEQASAHAYNKEYTVTKVRRPLQLNELVGEPLPFHELDEIIVALRTTEDITEDAIEQLARYIHDVELRVLHEQLADMVQLRKHYTARLVNLATRLPEHNEQGHAITTLCRPAENADRNAALVEAVALLKAAV